MQQTKSKDLLSEYASQLAYLVNDEAIAMDRYSTSDAARVLKTTTTSVHNWIKRGYIKYDIEWSISHVPGKKSREIARYVIPATEIDRILSAGPKLVQFTMRSWPRLLFKLNNGLPVW